MRPLNLPAILARAWRQFRDRRGRWFDMAIVPLIWLLALDMMLHGPVRHDRMMRGLESGEWIDLSLSSGTGGQRSTVIVEFGLDC